MFLLLISAKGSAGASRWDDYFIRLRWGWQFSGIAADLSGEGVKITETWHEEYSLDVKEERIYFYRGKLSDTAEYSGPVHMGSSTDTKWKKLRGNAFSWDRGLNQVFCKEVMQLFGGGGGKVRTIIRNAKSRQIVPLINKVYALRGQLFKWWT
jgi:hypothetical protein